MFPVPAAALGHSRVYDRTTLCEVVQLVLEQRAVRRRQLCDDVISRLHEVSQHGLVTRQAFLQLLNTINTRQNTHTGHLRLFCSSWVPNSSASKQSVTDVSLSLWGHVGITS